MSYRDRGNEVVALHDPDKTVENTPEAEYAPEAAAGPPLIDEGFVGESVAHISKQLDGTGLELVARRVLAKRGIEASQLRARSEWAAREANESFRPLASRVPLRDILEASATVAAAPRVSVAGRTVISAGPQAESIIPDADGDGRERVFDTSDYPYTAIAALEITARDGTLYVGTGWFVSPRTLITAGHCVYVRNAKNPAANGWVRSIRVFPGRNGTGPGSEPFGSVVATRFRSVSGWVSDDSDPERRAESDYGAILLPASAPPLGSQVGAFGIGVLSDADLMSRNLNVAGYPADKLHNERQTLWIDVKTPAHLTPRQVFYDADTYGGQSGAPVYVASGNKRIAVAIHAYGTSNTVASNSGTRITAEVFDRIQSWKT